MYRFWDSAIRPAFEATLPKTIVEIGASSGKHTSILLEYCKKNGGVVHVVDTNPSFDTDGWKKKYGEAFVLHRGKSLDLLPTIKQADAVLIDGDHNWYTVFHELKQVERIAGEQGFFPLVFLHDLDWPYARRDLYYNPEGVPAEYRKPYTQKGIRIGEHGLADGLGLNNELYHANEEGGARNGVLTAVEDFLKETKYPLRFTRIEGMHGLGILAPEPLLKKFPVLDAFLDTLKPTDAIGRHLLAVDRARLHSMTLESITQTEWSMAEKRLLAAKEEHARDLNELNEEKRKLLTEKEEASAKLLSVRNELAGAQAESANRQEKIDALEKTRADLETQLRQLVDTLAELEERRANLEEHVKALGAMLLELDERMKRMERSRSWRWTAPIRRFEAWMRNKPTQTPAVPATPKVPSPIKSTPEHEKDLERTVRWIRECKEYDEVLKPEWIAHEQPTVAVIIPCHNYARYLGEAIESVLKQSMLPSEIVVVDDASTDDTPNVAKRYAEKGVRYVRGEWKSVGSARNAGLYSTTADFLVFLDADDLLDPEYLKAGLDALLADRMSAVAYTDQQHFGSKELFYEAPETFDWERFDAMNHCHVTSMVRRDALLQAGGWSHGVGQDADWITWRRVFKLGWKAVKSRGLLKYRVHGDNMHGKLKTATYAQRAGFLEEKITLCLSLSGRTWAWPLTRGFLETQTFPHHLTHLIILDTSQNDAFGKEVKDWLAASDYGGHTYLAEAVARKGLADLPRAEAAIEVASACAAIYNRFARLVRTPLVCFLEDDVVPPPDAYVRLINLFDWNVASVSAAVFQRRNAAQPIVWKWTPNGHQRDDVKQTGVTDVGGNGFGCCVIRGDRIARTVFRTGPGPNCFDHNFYRDTVFERQLRALVDWGCVCKHHHTADTWN